MTAQAIKPSEPTLPEQVEYWRGQADLRQKIIQVERIKRSILQRRVDRLTASVVDFENQLGDQL